MRNHRLEKAIEVGTRMHDHAIDALAYCVDDIKITHDYWRYMNIDLKNISIKKVVFNDPATIIIWSDNTKTVVKCSKDDTFDPEKGLAMAISKRIYGNNFKKIFKEWLPEKIEYVITTKLYADDKSIEIVKNNETTPILCDEFGYLDTEFVERFNKR